MIIRISFIYCIFSLIPFFGFAQFVITGTLRNEQNYPIDNVTISYKKIGAAAILGFARSDDKGQYKLSFKVTDVDSLQLEFNHLSYAKKNIHVANASGNYSYILKTETRKIQEVKVADPPISFHKDTLNYTVDAFTSKKDQVIADIIKKLPGVEIRGDQILYQGKAIQKYMVNNLDLMEGRYAMINNNLPADVVKSIQIVENDQPIKILDSIVFSDRATLNLELKNFTSTGTGKIGVGAAPFLWDFNLTPMTFGKKFQMLNSFQTNNIGNNVSKDLRQFYTSGLFFGGTNEAISNGPSFISLRNANTPDFEESKWLDNRIFLLNNNFLQKLKNNLEIKGNISYFNDYRKSQGFIATQFYTVDQTILTSETIDNRNRNQTFDIGVTLEKNSKNIYFKNTFKYRENWNRANGGILLNNQDQISQNRDYNDKVLYNVLSITSFIGKQLFSINSVVEKHQTPQYLIVRPGQMDRIINNGIPYEQMKQYVNFNSFKTGNNLGFTRSLNRWKVSPKISVDYNQNILISNAKLTNNGQDKDLGANFLNDVKSSQLQMSLSSGFTYENLKWKIIFNTPFSLFVFNYRQQQFESLSNENKTTFNPSSTIVYSINSRNELLLNTSGGKKIGGLSNFYSKYIINSYRSLQRYDDRLLSTNLYNINVNYNYKNLFNANFLHLSYHFQKSVNDYIFNNKIDELGQSTISVESQKNTAINHNVKGGLSKFFSEIKTIVKLNGNISLNTTDYFLNTALVKQKSWATETQFEIINNYFNFLNLEYRTNYNYAIIKLVNNQENSIKSNNHFLNIVTYPLENHMISINNSYYKNNLTNQYFLDASYRFHVKKWRTDLQLMLQNLLNNNSYVQQLSTTFQLMESRFELRPRQFIISTSIRF